MSCPVQLKMIAQSVDRVFDSQSEPKLNIFEVAGLMQSKHLKGRLDPPVSSEKCM